jgi:hypothetical protein
LCGRLSVPAIDAVEITAQRIKRKFLGLNLALGAHSFAAENWYRRAPTLHRVLKQKWQDDARNREKFLVYE